MIKWDYFFSGKFLECKGIKFLFLNNFMYIFRFLRYVSSLEKRYYTEDLHCKKEQWFSRPQPGCHFWPHEIFSG